MADEKTEAASSFAKNALTMLATPAAAKKPTLADMAGKLGLFVPADQGSQQGPRLAEGCCPMLPNSTGIEIPGKPSPFVA
jgi:hypothetical protein